MTFAAWCAERLAKALQLEFPHVEPPHDETLRAHGWRPTRFGRVWEHLDRPGEAIHLEGPDRSGWAHHVTRPGKTVRLGDGARETGPFLSHYLQRLARGYWVDPQWWLRKAQVPVRAYQRTGPGGEPVAVGSYTQERTPSVGDTLHYTGAASGAAKSGVIQQVHADGSFTVQKPSGFVTKVAPHQVTGHTPKGQTSPQGTPHGKTIPLPGAAPKAAGASAPSTPATPSAVLDHVIQATGMTREAVVAALTAPSAAPKHAHVAEARMRITAAIYSSGLAQPDAARTLLEAHHDAKVVAAHVRALATGDVERAVKEYAHTPLYDLQVLGGIHWSPKPVHGQANCQMVTRVVTMGATSASGDARHELGHAIHAAWGGGAGHGGKTPLTKAVAAEYQTVKQKAQQDPAGTKAKLSHEYYETTYGIIGRRGLDSDSENMAEHYRGYHKALYQDRFEGGEGTHLAAYRQRHPGWARLWDAWYTGALLGALAKAHAPEAAA